MGSRRHSASDDLVEEQDKVEGEGDEQCQKTQVVEVPRQIVLYGQKRPFY